MRVAVVIPALDEEESLPLVLRDLPPVWKVVVCDNGSRDRTADVARAAGAHVVHAPRRGYGSAVLAGIAHLRADPPDILVILDADHADHGELLDRLVDPLVDGVKDLVIADRSRTALPGALTLQQIAGNRLATSLMAMVSGHRYADMGPFRAIRWSSLESLGMEDPTWGWNVEMQLKAVRRGLRIAEIPLPYRPRAFGRSKISGSVRGTLRAGARILWAVRRYRKDREPV